MVKDELCIGTIKKRGFQFLIILTPVLENHEISYRYVSYLLPFEHRIILFLSTALRCLAVIQSYTLIVIALNQIRTHQTQSENT